MSAGAEPAHERALLQMVAAQDAERRDVADAVHDDTLQVLAAAQVRLQVLARRLATEGLSEHAATAAGIDGTVGDAVARLRRMLFALAPPELEGGLGPALRDLAAQLLAPAGLAYEVVDACGTPPNDAVGHVLHRVAREALANVVRHAGATTVAVTLADDGTGWSVQVSDDGRGPGVGGFEGLPGHRGIASMRDRVAAAGGTLDLWAAEPSGTTVRAWVPAHSGALLADQPVLDLKEPLREILDESAEAFIAFDLEWRYVFLNRPAAQLAERPARELEGTHVWAEYPELVGSAFQRECLRAMTLQRPVEYTSFTGGRWLETRLFPSPNGLFAYLRDVTDAREGEGSGPDPRPGA